MISVTVALWGSVLLGCRDVRGTFRRVKRAENCVGSGGRRGKAGRGMGNGEVVVEVPYPREDLKGRVQWVLTLLVSMRLTGWRIGEERHDRTQPPKRIGRKEFLRHALGILVLDYLLLDAAFLYVSCDPYFTISGVSVDAPFPALSKDSPWLLTWLHSLPPRFLRSSVLAAQAYGLVSGAFYLPTVPAVALNALDLLPDEWSPHSWPKVWGEFSAVWERGLRGLWGKWWHQLDREMAGTLGKALSKSLGLGRPALLGYICAVTAAFFFTGVMHAGMIPPEPLSDKLSAMEMRLYIAGFFWAQAPIIAAEASMSGYMKRHAPSVRLSILSKVAPLVWVALWLCLTLPLIVPPFREIGYWKLNPVPVSVLQSLWTTMA